MRLLALTILFILCSSARAATTITGGVLAASDTTGTNARPSAVTITARTNLASGTLQVTNVVTLGSGGTAATLQTDTNGTIQATSAASGDNPSMALDTNFYVFPNGGIVIDKGASDYGFPDFGESFITSRREADGWTENALELIFKNVTNDLATAELYADNSSASVKAAWGNQTAIISAGTANAYLWLVTPAGISTQLKPTSADGQTPYIFDTSVAHTSGNLVEVKNNGNATLTLDFGAYLTLTDHSGTDEAGVEVNNPTAGLRAYLIPDRLNINDLITLTPFSSAGNPIASIDSSVAHTSGNLAELKNNGTNIVQITATTATSTNTPFILNINGTQTPVWLGPPGSGGTGLRALVVAN